MPALTLPPIVGHPDFPAFAVAQAIALITASTLLHRRLPHRIITAAFVAGTLIGGASLGLLLRLPRAALHRADLFAPGWPMAYGALAGASIAVWLAARKRSFDVPTALDALAPSLGVLVIAGRLGCLVAGCCFGAPASSPLAVAYPPGTPAYANHLAQHLISSGAAASAPTHPAPLYEMIAGALMIGASISMPAATRRGTSFWAVVVTYAVARFAIEIVRGDVRPMAGPLSLPQWLSLATLAIALFTWSRSALTE